MKKKKAMILVGVLAVVAVVAIAACAPKAALSGYGNPTPTVAQATVTPEVDKYGLVKATQWAEAYPYEYQSYLENSSNTPPSSDYLGNTYIAQGYASKTEDVTSTLPEGWKYVDAKKADYLETNPEIKILGLGYGYAKYYTEPASHVFSLWTVAHNGRVGDGTKTKAACITCKSPQYSNLVDMEGESVHLRPFNEVITDLDENISCASCHANTPMKDGEVYLEVDRAEWIRAMGSDAGNTINGEVCGQCHCDYSMAPGTSIPTSPYDNGRVDMVPEKALQWYDDHNYADWTYESTGAKMLAIRHAEYEFIYGGDNEILPQGSHMQNLGYDCNDCHMPTKTAVDGTVYADHNWTSPTENDALIKRDCSTCHKDLKAEVKAWQTEIDGATTLLGNRCVKFIQNFEAAIANGNLTDAELDRLRWIQRASCYYWNLAAAENSEGAHNPTYYRHTLEMGNTVLDEGDSILNVPSKTQAGN
ncbi:MAG: ammonia-forming cytochrome c nitrite reductase subunit c552 [Eggerthellaceae bacterium]|nr:ammonia-forming cytochrome c nitrite reductase subunit c552 [Eggerthellaceae bacterium]